jgi:hypothetical protein
MIPINIDISQAMARIMPTQEEVRDYSRFVLDSIVTRYIEMWEKEVDNSLHQTKRAYKAGMPESVNYLDDYTAEVVLNGKGDSKLAIMIEKGASAFDIKDGFEKSSKVKHNKDGDWYLTVPFKWATSEAIAESSVFSGKMPKPVQNIVKREGKTTTTNLPSEFQVKGVRKEISNGGVTIPAYEHKSSIYLGIVKSDKPQHSGATSFRRAGKNSDDGSWMHKGFEPHNFMGKAVDKLLSEIPSILKNAETQFFQK